MYKHVYHPEEEYQRWDQNPQHLTGADVGMLTWVFYFWNVVIFSKYSHGIKVSCHLQVLQDLFVKWTWTTVILTLALVMFAVLTGRTTSTACVLMVLLEKSAVSVVVFLTHLKSKCASTSHVSVTYITTRNFWKDIIGYSLITIKV